MTATEMEDLKTDGNEIEAFRVEMKGLFADYNRHISMLFERTQATLEVITAQLADISQRLPPRA